MITVEEAQALCGVDEDSVAAAAKIALSDIEGEIRAAAQFRKRRACRVEHLISDWAAGVVGKPAPIFATVREGLIGQGFSVTVDAGGHGGRGYVEVSW